MQGLPPKVRVAGRDAAENAGGATTSDYTRGIITLVSGPMVFNLFADLPQHLPDELFTTLLEAAHVRIERIVSHGHASPEGFWFDQDQHEWLVVLHGAARLRFADDEQPVTLNAGDCMNIPAHKKHRVEWTTPDEPTIWLAAHYGDQR